MEREFMADQLRVTVYADRAQMGVAAAYDTASAIVAALAPGGTGGQRGDRGDGGNGRPKEQLNIVFAAAPSQNEFLAALLADSRVPWQLINAFHMDEYIGLSPDAPQGFGNFLRERLFGLAPFRSVHYINPGAPDPEGECRRYADLLRQHPPDIVCMGIGENGHIAFNDPHVALFNDPELVKVIELDERCRQQQVNDGCFASLAEVPTRAVTLTIPALVSVPRVCCVVPATTKAEAVLATVRGPVTQECPASVLRCHPNATLYLDCDSAGLLA